MGSWTPGEDGETSRLKNVVPKVEAVRSMRCVLVPMRRGLTTQSWYAEFIDGSVVGSLDNVICKAQDSCVALIWLGELGWLVYYLRYAECFSGEWEVGLNS